MKKGIILLTVILVSIAVNAQCIINPLQTQLLSPMGDSLPCAEKGVSYETYLYFNFDVTSLATIFPVTVTVDSIKITSANNLPSGLQWELQPVNPFYIAGDRGCIRVFGITNDNVGAYTLGFDLEMYLDVPGLGQFVQYGDLANPDTTQISNGPIINVIQPGDSCGGTGGNTFNYISGRVYHDVDNNNQYNSGDIPLMNYPVTFTQTNLTTYTNAQGEYLNVMGTGAFTVEADVSYLYSPLGSNPLTVSFLGLGDSAVNMDFPMSIPDTITDLEVMVTSLAARPGFPHTQFITINNVGNSSSSGELTLQYDTVLDFVSSTFAPSTHIANRLTWTIPTIAPLQSTIIQLQYTLPPNINLIGDTLKSTATINNIVADIDTFNNIFQEEVVVTASYDPNDKTPYPTDKLDEAFIDSGEPLRYRIRFQNTGTDTAFNITVRDTLDLDKFDVNSIHLLGASHEYIFRIEQGNIAIWEFANILLPDSNVNEPGSHGFIMLELDLLPGLGQGDQVLNRAGIYFDFNPVVLTDYAISRVDFSSGIRDEAFNNSSITLYPNPTQNRLVIAHEQWQQGATIMLVDLTGKLMLNKPLDGKTTEISTANLPNGMYLYQVIGAFGIEGVGKVVIAK